MERAENVTALQPDTMGIEELAKRLGIGMTVCYGLAQRNELPIPAIKVGRQWRFSRVAYERWLARENEAAGNVA